MFSSFKNNIPKKNIKIKKKLVDFKNLYVKMTNVSEKIKTILILIRREKMTSKHDYIQEAAYFIWLNRGKPEGQDLEIWDEATKIYELTHATISTVKSVKPVAKKTVKKATKKVAKKVAPKAEKKEVKKTTVKKVATKKAPAKKAVKPVAKKVEVAKIIPMVKKEVATKKSTPKTKIKIVVGGKK